MKPAFCALAAGLALSLAAHAAPPQALYQQHCQSCHGEQRLGAMAPALLPQSLERIKPAEVLATIRDGRPATQMAGFASQLEAGEIQALADWLRTPPATPPRWDDADMAASHVQPVALASLPATIWPVCTAKTAWRCWTPGSRNRACAAF